MSPGGALLTFVSVFVAALLAFYLDGLREKRATQRWLHEYLGFWRGFMDSLGDEGEQNEAGVRVIERALDEWLAGAGPKQVEWGSIDAMNVNATVRFTGHLLSAASAGMLPAELMRQLFLADAMAPTLTARAQFVTRLFESDVRPLVLDRVAPIDGRDRRAVELYRHEFLGLFALLQSYSEHMRGIQAELTRLGF
jgi:hypothetical protein